MALNANNPNSKQPLPRAPVAVGDVIPRVPSTDGAAIRTALTEVGVCICTGAATAGEVEKGQELFWDWVESFKDLNIKRSDVSSIGNHSWNQLCFPKNGVFSKAGVGQTDFMWHSRMLPGVQRCFSSAWDLDDLITSFDGCGAFRNPWASKDVSRGSIDRSWLTTGGWFHIDQSWHTNPGLVSYQGVLNYLPATAATGSTVLVPGSHRRFKEVFADPKRSIKDVRQGSVDYVKLTQPGDFQKYCQEAVQVETQAGDLLLWDSRTIHCAQGVDDNASESELAAINPVLSRLIAYVCMVPRSHLRNARGSRVKRNEFVLKGTTSGHNPLVIADGSRSVNPSYTPPSKKNPIWTLV